MAKAPMRENMAALLLRLCGYDGREPVLDPLCGSGTFVIEAAEWAAGLHPGRNRSFAFEQLATFRPDAWRELRTTTIKSAAVEKELMFHGSDRDAGAITAASANATRAGVSAITRFERKAISDIAPPEGPPGLVIMNPPYGARIGEAKKLEALYVSIGKVMHERFAGWRVGLITSNDGLARKTGLPWTNPSAPILHGGLRVKLWQTRLT
jgi:putative N6-adenine-specific DNA methylase